jgi:hypothetical protein
MSGRTSGAVLLVLCAAVAALVAAVPASAAKERRVFFTIKSVTGSYVSDYNVPRGLDANHFVSPPGCGDRYVQGRGHERVAFRSKRPARANAVWDTLDRQPHWRMNFRPYPLPIAQTITREAHITEEYVYRAGCGPGTPRTDVDSRSCGGPEVYRIDGASLAGGVTIGPHNRRPYNSFDVQNWQGTTDYLRDEHPLKDCSVYGTGAEGNTRIENGMWRIARGRWKRKTLHVDRTWTGEVCLGTSYLYDPPEPPCGPVTTRITWTVKLVRRPDPRR